MEQHIINNFTSIVATLPSYVQLVVVSKLQPIEHIVPIYESGHRVFGESKVQELVPKHASLPKDIQWHMIGHLQTNKVKYIAPFVTVIHSVDSQKLLSTINKEAQKNQRVIDCLLQMHIAEEETKYGFDFEEVCALLESSEYARMNNIRLIGMMCMATYTPDTAQITREFSSMKSYFDKIKDQYFKNTESFKDLSMGMSSDYQLAIQSGSTMVRIGSSIFA